MLLTSSFVRGKVMDDLDFKVGTKTLVRKVVMSCSDGGRTDRQSAVRPTSSYLANSGQSDGRSYLQINLNIQRVLKVALPRTHVPRSTT
jgi:hypothetical protein